MTNKKNGSAPEQAQTELEIKISKLKKEDALQKEIQSKIQGIDFYSLLATDYIKGDKPRVLFTFKTVEGAREGIAKIVAAFPAFKNNTIYNGHKDEPTAHPLRLTFKNPCMYERKAQIDYKSASYDIAIELPESYYKNEVIQTGERSIAGSEYHYFTAHSQRELDNIRVRQVRLNGYECQKYYGGSATCYITDETQGAQFEKVVLTGTL